MTDPIIESTPVDPEYMKAICPECGKELKDGLMLMVDPPQYEHSCVCGYICTLENRYPTVGYKWKEGYEPVTESDEDECTNNNN